MSKRKNQAAVCRALSGPTDIVMSEISVPECAEDSVIIEVKAAALNFPDLLMTYGKYQFRPELPFIIGMEGSGIIMECGKNVSDFQVGDEVIFRGKTDACSSYVLRKPSDLLRKPRHLNFAEAAAFGVTFQTAYVSLVRRGHLKAGETLLVTGAGGGVGQACVAVGKAVGAHVIAAASSAEKLKIAKDSGADFLINYSEEPLEERLNEITDGQGVEVVADPVGGAVLEKCVRALSWQGRLLIIGFASGDFGAPDLAEIQSKSIAMIGVRAGEYGRRNPKAGMTALNELIELAEDQEIRPHIGKEWELEEVPSALKAMEERTVVGKQIVLIG